MQLNPVTAPAPTASPLFTHVDAALSYTDFLARHANEGQKERWQRFHQQVALTDAQREVLGSFTRETHVLVMAGAWCGDCINQCPIFEHFAAAAPVLKVRYIDRDADLDLKAALRVNGGDRVPVVVFFSEDGQEVSRFGDRTISRYRQLVRDQVGPSCATGIVATGDPLTGQVIQDWLDEFERVQWILRLSSRLRTKHGD